MARSKQIVAPPRPLQANQGEAIAFLSDPSSFAGGGPVDRCETHANLIFLSGDEAWKIKRAIRLPYLDFSTLEKRHRACLREVEINRRLAPELYLGCLPITRRREGGGLGFAGEGEVIEWCVHMRRFDQSALLSNVAQTRGIGQELAASLADAVLESHKRADPISPALVTGLFDNAVSSLCTSLGRCRAFDAELGARFAASVARQHEQARALLNERASKDCVRRCHGDLHLANIVLWKGRPVLYDAIEFDDAIASTDTLYDLAFLLMDLDRYQQRHAANAVINRYMWRADREIDLRGLKALPLFLGVRAGVRARVSADRAAQQHDKIDQEDKGRARTYMQAALEYLNPPSPRLVAVGGLSGTGKTTLAALLAPAMNPAPGALHFRSDLERKAVFGVDERTRLGRDAYAPAASDHVYARLRRKARLSLAAGHSVIVDAVHSSAEERARVERVAAGLALPFQGIWLHSEPQHLMERVRRRRDDASDADEAVVRRQLELDIGPLSAAWTIVDANRTTEEVFAEVSMILHGAA